MRNALVHFAWLAMLTGQIAWSQTGQPEGTAEAPATPIEDFKPASTNQPGRQYPQVNSEGRVRARISAPEAQSVFLDINGIKFPMTKDANGVWTGDSAPFDEGNHYYRLWIDGAQVPDPGSTFIFGSGSWQNDIEIPAKDQDFYALKNVPHGQLREVFYFGKTSNAIRHSFVYTPPDYDKDPSKRFPVLYLQHGYNEGESGWGAQGHAGLIMDNLIAEGKAKPFIIVMENGGISGGPGGRGGRAGGAPAAAQAPGGGPAAGRAPAPGGRGRGGVNFGAFEQVLIDDVIPYVDANFRTIADQPHRALAGLSMGGMQTRQISLAHPELFAYVGIFSGGTISATEIANNTDFKDKAKLVFVSYGSREGGSANMKTATDGLIAAGIKAVSYTSPQTAHEWQTWRRSLHEFAPLIFQD